MDSKGNVRAYIGFFSSSLFVAILWLIKYQEETNGLSFASYGIRPRTISGLKGILTGPLVHGDYDHLINNSLPLLVLGTALYFFYSKVALRVFVLSYLITGVWVWAGSRMSYHIGASGLIYSMTAFLFVSGVIRKNIRLLSISMMVVFLYGSLIWGILPIKPQVSWESHLLGGVVGVIMAFFYRHSGPKDDRYDWEDEEDDENEEGNVVDVNYTIIE
ncbi:MAG: rhomboid family intramembrane serine protease [Flavobacteriales bacterium]|nr:rhomboid family intramembrane serine protease [Flavobacteriales bacterium]